ncbi:hypothetical protein Anapl_02326 [Anas platyrhynchos]|uniref:Uncharacterized protein n=1 Tax=Anas platyrhynchos TaxID=8839 RepID=R0LL79_ANAPL|nr:hypothetical protein Anapl_02326 [Anas platyrhynchos]
MLTVLAPGRAGLGHRLPIPEALGGERSAPLRARCLSARLTPFGQRWLLGFLPRGAAESYGVPRETPKKTPQQNPQTCTFISFWLQHTHAFICEDESSLRVYYRVFLPTGGWYTLQKLCFESHNSPASPSSAPRGSGPDGDRHWDRVWDRDRDCDRDWDQDQVWDRDRDRAGVGDWYHCEQTALPGVCPEPAVSSTARRSDFSPPKRSIFCWCCLLIQLRWSWTSAGVCASAGASPLAAACSSGRFLLEKHDRRQHQPGSTTEKCLRCSTPAYCRLLNREHADLLGQGSREMQYVFTSKLCFVVFAVKSKAEQCDPKYYRAFKFLSVVSPFYATGRTVWYFQKEMIVAEEFGNTVISKISAGIQGEKIKRVLALILLRSNDGKNKSEMITLTIADLEEVRIWQGVAVEAEQINARKNKQTTTTNKNRKGFLKQDTNKQVAPREKRDTISVTTACKDAEVARCSMPSPCTVCVHAESKFRSDFIMQTQQSVARDGALKCLQPKPQQCPVSDSKHQETQLQPQICSTILSLRAVLCRGRWSEELRENVVRTWTKALESLVAKLVFREVGDAFLCSGTITLISPSRASQPVPSPYNPYRILAVKPTPYITRARSSNLEFLKGVSKGGEQIPESSWSGRRRGSASVHALSTRGPSSEEREAGERCQWFYQNGFIRRGRATRLLIIEDEKAAAVSNAYPNHSVLGLWNNFANKITPFLQRPQLGEGGLVRARSPSAFLVEANGNPELTPRQIAGKLKEGHEHLGAFAAVLPAKTTSFSPHSGPQTKLEQPAWAHRSFVLGPRVAVLGPNEQRSCAELCTERLRALQTEPWGYSAQALLFFQAWDFAKCLHLRWGVCVELHRLQDEDNCRRNSFSSAFSSMVSRPVQATGRARAPQTSLPPLLPPLNVRSSAAASPAAVLLIMPKSGCFSSKSCKPSSPSSPLLVSCEELVLRRHLCLGYLEEVSHLPCRSATGAHTVLKRVSVRAF